MPRKYLSFYLSISLLIITIYFINYFNLIDFFKFATIDKNNLVLQLNTVYPNLKSITADSSNDLLLKVKVLTKNGSPVKRAHVFLSTSNNLGFFSLKKILTNEKGIAYTVFTPKDSDNLIHLFRSSNPQDYYVVINAYIPHTDIISTIRLELKRPPVILLHGFLATSEYMDNLKNYLINQGFLATAIEYDSTIGIIESANDVRLKINDYRNKLFESNILVGKFDVVAHSMGGTVIRYYSVSSDYLKYENIRKAIYVSVPHKGSPWASLTSNYFDNKGIIEMIPSNPLYTTIFPSMINHGLNHKIQVANIAVENDEVVPLESSSLEAWDIKTEMFNIGESTITMEKIISGDLLQSAIHKKLLNNVRVFQRIIALLSNNLPYPALKQ